VGRHGESEAQALRGVKMKSHGQGVRRASPLKLEAKCLERLKVAPAGILHVGLILKV